MNRTTLALLAALAVALILSGCGGGPGPSVPTGSISGTAVTAGTLASLSGVTVTVVENGRTTTTDAQGAFTLTGLAVGNYTLRLTKATYEQRDRPIAVIEGENPSLGQIAMVPSSVTLPPGQDVPMSIKGSVLLAGQSNASGVTVQLVEGSTVLDTTATASDGSYHFWIWAGSYTVKFSKTGYVAKQSSVTVTNPDTLVTVPTVTLQAQ